jgi:competence ComEA-like helix-hairpin-helix protein
MKPTGCVSSAIYTDLADEKPARDKAVFASRVGICGFWAAAGLVGCLFLSVLTAWSSATRSLPRPLDTINPNNDPQASLVRLSGVGPARAIAIIAYRNKHRDGRAFCTPADLDAVAGFGPKTVEKMTPWISFDGVDERTQ